MRVSWIVVSFCSLLLVLASGCKKDKPSAKAPAGGQKGDKIEAVKGDKADKPAAKKGDPDVKNDDEDDGKPQPYTLTVTAPAAAKAGSEMVAEVKMVPAEGYKVNLEYPTKLEINSPKGGNPDKVVLKAKQAAELTEKVLLLKPTFKMPRPGDHQFSGRLKFSVCTEKLCEIKNKQVKWVAKVTE